MKRALLLLTGGRGVPDMLTIKYLQPDIIYNITTIQGKKNALDLQQFTHTYFHRNIEILPTINPFDEDEIKNACEMAIQQLPDAEWIIHFTGSPKIIGIYAHDIARKHNIPFCFLDTEGLQVISLVKRLPINNALLFKASVEEYMGAYGRKFEIPKPLEYRLQAQSWHNISKMLIQMPDATSYLLKAVRTLDPREARAARTLNISIDISAKQLVQTLKNHELLTIIDRTNSSIQCKLSNSTVYEFLMGDWLEVYVWHEAVKAGFADDYQWGYKIIVDKKIAETLPSNELDLVLTYNARLLIAECKTSRMPFDSQYLDKLYSISNLIGGGYVRQAFITNALRPQGKQKDRFDSFCRQAEVRHISVITGEQLPDIGKLLGRQIGALNQAH